jgi:hypothetical protein
MVSVTGKSKSQEEADGQNPTKNKGIEQSPQERPPGKTFQDPYSSTRQVGNTSTYKESSNPENHTLPTFASNASTYLIVGMMHRMILMGKSFPFIVTFRL